MIKKKRKMINKKFAGLVVLALLLFSCGEKKEIAVGDIVKKRVGGDKLKMVVLSVNEHDEKGNLTHKKIGNYKPQVNGGKKITYFFPECKGFYEVWYDNEYDDRGNLTRTFIHNSKDTESWDYSFEYDGEGKIIYAKTKIHPVDYIEGAFDESECFYSYDEKGSISHFKASDEDADFLPDEFKYYEWDYKSEYEDDSVLTEIIALFNKCQIRRKYDEEGKIERVRLSDDNSPWWEDPIIDYYYSKTMKSEYYYNYTKRFYGYGDYLGSENLPLGIDGKLNLNTLNWDYKNRDTKTLIEYYLREDGTVEKSIEYTGKEQFKHYASMEFPKRHGGFSSYDVPSLFPFYEYK